MNQSNSTLAAAAQAIAAHGWTLLPVHGISPDGRCTCGKTHADPKEVGKHPALYNWNSEASSDPEVVAKWWEQNPDYNIGVVCNKSGFFVIDIDPRNGGDDSFQVLEERAEGSLILTVEAITGEYNVRGRVVRGRHLFYKCDPNEKFLGNLAKEGLKGIDVKHNGYVVLAPSRHFSGVNYEWAAGKAPWETELAEAPDELMNCLRKSQKKPVYSIPESKKDSFAYLAKISPDFEKFDLEKVLNEGLREGERAVGIYQLACSMANKYGTSAQDEEWIISRLLDFNAEKIIPPLEVEGSNGLLMHVRNAIQFVATNPAVGVVAVNPYGQNLADSHDSAATEWVAGFLGGNFCWSKFTGWLGYENGVWASRSDENIREEVRKAIHEKWKDAHLDPNQHSALPTLKAFLSKARLSGIESLLRGHLEVKPELLDGNVALLNAKNGVIDLKTGALLPHDPNYYFTKQTHCDYIANAKHPDWDKALEAVPSYALDYIQSCFGNGLTGHILNEDIALILGGGGRNGKSTICDLTLKVLGTFAVLASPALLTGKDSDHTTELADLVGKRFALLEEFPMRSSLNVSRLKRVVGTAEISARRMRQDNQTWVASHTLIITTNHEIQIPAGDDGTWRRLIKINLPYRYVAEPTLAHDRPVELGLRERLLEGAEGQHTAVLAWLVQGAVAWFANGRKLPPLPSEVREEIDTWRGSQDVLGTFLTTHLELDPTSYVAQQDLYEMFKKETEGGWDLRDQNSFVLALKSHEFIVSNGLKAKRERHATKKLSRPNNPIYSSELRELHSPTMLIQGLRFKS